ncbi:MAG: hypothetical protein AAGL49_04215, partial [Pseudomonadota bacterium]
DVAEIDATSVRRHVAFLPTTARMFPGTLLDNVAMFREGEAQRHAVETLRELGLHDYIASLPKGLETEIGGAQTKMLPAGFTQALAIARALVDDRQIVLFDYAHKSIDHLHDRRLLELIARMKGRKTLILVTQRPSYLRLCDRVLELENGGLKDLPAPTATTREAARGQTAPPLTAASAGAA